MNSRQPAYAGMAEAHEANSCNSDGELVRALAVRPMNRGGLSLEQNNRLRCAYFESVSNQPKCNSVDFLSVDLDLA